MLRTLTSATRTVHALVASLMLSVIAADVPGSQGGRRAHPRPEYLVRPAGVPVTPLETTSMSADGLALGSRLRGARRIAIIGSSDGPPEHLLGEVAGVAIGPRDRVYVLDGQFHNVRVFANDGSLVQTFAREGQGPGEFMVPSSLTLRRDPLRLYVADRIRRIHEFSIDSEVGYSRSQVTKTDADSVCSFADTLVTSGKSVGIPNAIHEYNSAGDVLSEFGSIYSSPHGAVNGALSGSLIACDPAEEFVLLAARDLGEVRKYSRDGQLQWIIAATDFRHADIVEEGVMVYVAVPEDGFEGIDSLVLMSSDLGLAQVVEHTRRDSAPTPAKVESFAIATAEGDSQSLAGDIPHILAISDRHFVASEGILNPLLGIYELPDRD